MKVQIALVVMQTNGADCTCGGAEMVQLAAGSGAKIGANPKPWMVQSGANEVQSVHVFAPTWRKQWCKGGAIAHVFCRNWCKSGVNCTCFRTNDAKTCSYLCFHHVETFNSGSHGFRCLL